MGDILMIRSGTGKRRDTMQNEFMLGMITCNKNELIRRLKAIQFVVLTILPKEDDPKRSIGLALTDEIRRLINDVESTDWAKRSKDGKSN
jgi:hypothetical protein